MVMDSVGNKIKAGDKVVCVKKSKLAPELIDSELGKIFTVIEARYVDSDINPGNNIILDCHPIVDSSRQMKMVASLSNRFVKIASSTKNREVST